MIFQFFRFQQFSILFRSSSLISCGKIATNQESDDKIISRPQIALKLSGFVYPMGTTCWVSLKAVRRLKPYLEGNFDRKSCVCGNFWIVPPWVVANFSKMSRFWDFPPTLEGFISSFRWSYATFYGGNHIRILSVLILAQEWCSSEPFSFSQTVVANFWSKFPKTNLNSVLLLSSVD